MPLQTWYRNPDHTACDLSGLALAHAVSLSPEARPGEAHHTHFSSLSRVRGVCASQRVSHSPPKGHLGSFQSWVIKDKATADIHAQVWHERKSPFLQGKGPGEPLLSRILVACLIL